jgi:energy-coupling factor transport system ATP-binding protein
MLSRGEKQLVALAATLALQPGLLILDEPTCGLDTQAGDLVMQAVQQLNANGTTVVMISHDMDLVAANASRVLTMSDGKVVEQSC